MDDGARSQSFTMQVTELVCAREHMTKAINGADDSSETIQRSWNGMNNERNTIGTDQ